MRQTEKTENVASTVQCVQVVQLAAKNAMQSVHDDVWQSGWRRKASSALKQRWHWQRRRCGGWPVLSVDCSISRSLVATTALRAARIVGQLQQPGTQLTWTVNAAVRPDQVVVVQCQLTISVTKKPVDTQRYSGSLSTKLQCSVCLFRREHLGSSNEFLMASDTCAVQRASKQHKSMLIARLRRPC